VTVLVLGTFDTKGPELDFVRDLLRANGTRTVAVDVSVLGDPSTPVDHTAAEVAAIGGSNLDELRSAGDRGAALTAMSRGARTLARQLAESGEIHGIVSLGGSGGSAITATVMRALPLGFPKLLVSTMASGDVSPYVGQSDVTLMYSVVDVAGLNSISRPILCNAAAAIGAMAAAYQVASSEPRQLEDRPLIAATMFGVTTPAVHAAQAWLERHGYEVLVFHATGSGGRTMESLVREGKISGVLDITTTEIADELVGGVLSAGPERLTAAARCGVPQVVSLGAIDMVNFGPVDTVPSRFSERHLLQHNETVTLMRTTPEEAARIGRDIGEKLRSSSAPVAIFLPLGGTSAIDAQGGPFWDPDADQAAFGAVRRALDDSTAEIVTSSENINSPAFAEAMAECLHHMLENAR
jgi:uncharacterized protein (UPF0261 family)